MTHNLLNHQDYDSFLINHQFRKSFESYINHFFLFLYPLLQTVFLFCNFNFVAFIQVQKVVVVVIVIVVAWWLWWLGGGGGGLVVVVAWWWWRLG